MTYPKHTAPAAAQPSRDFDQLNGRLLGLVHHLRCADQVLYDLQSVPPELQPAAIVVHDATEALDRLHTELDEWSVSHRTPEELRESAAQLEKGMSAEERERFRASMSPRARAAVEAQPAPVSPNDAEREPVGESTEGVLRAAMCKLGDARAMLSVALRSLGDEAGEEEIVFERALEMLEDVSSSIDYASMGWPKKAPVWPDAQAHKEALDRATREELARRQERQPS